jgi:hypothetical protein
MRTLLILIAMVLGLASPAATGSEQFATDTPSPLRLTHGGNSEGTVARFSGKVRLSGRFLVAWDLVNQVPRYLRVTFLPDDASTMLLPHAAGSAPVKELMLSNNEAAARLLLDAKEAAKVFAKEVLSLEGEATVTVGDYRSVVECDQRRYLAHLLSVANSRGVAVAANEGKRSGC